MKERKDGKIKKNGRMKGKWQDERMDERKDGRIKRRKECKRMT